jgi:hypothetical protein
LDDNDVLFTAEEAATYLAVSRRSLDRLGLERIVYTPKLIRYAKSTLDAYRAQCTMGRKPTMRIKSRVVKPKGDAEFERWLKDAKGKGA